MPGLLQSDCRMMIVDASCHLRQQNGSHPVLQAPSFMPMTLNLMIGIVLGLAVWVVQSCGAADDGTGSSHVKRFEWLAPTLTVLVSGIVLWIEPNWASAVPKAVLAACLIALASIDIRFQVLPNVLTLPLLAIGLTLSVTGLSLPLGPAIGGAVMGFMLLAVPGLVYQRWKKTEGVGWGDIKLTTAIGAWLGWEAISQIVLFASLLAGLWGMLVVLLRHHEWNQLLPFGPFIALAAIVVIIV